MTAQESLVDACVINPAMKYRSPADFAAAAPDDDTCDLEAPRAGSCWSATFLPRGVKVRTSLAARNLRRTLKNSPNILLAMVLTSTVEVPIGGIEGGG